jgi:hypothetical protein
LSVSENLVLASKMLTEFRRKKSTTSHRIESCVGSDISNLWHSIITPVSSRQSYSSDKPWQDTEVKLWMEWFLKWKGPRRILPLAIHSMQKSRQLMTLSPTCSCSVRFKQSHLRSTMREGINEEPIDPASTDTLFSQIDPSTCNLIFLFRDLRSLPRRCCCPIHIVSGVKLWVALM